MQLLWTNKKNICFGNGKWKWRRTKYINKGDITKTLDAAQVTYEYKEINLSNAKEVSNIIMDVLVYSSKYSISKENFTIFYLNSLFSYFFE